jgi:CzcA family heavy metal efflux pump
MWIVRLALTRPYTFIVLALAILLMGVYSLSKTPTDIFPNIKIPVVATIWSYSGLSPYNMATRIILSSERSAATIVNDVEHTESTSLNGIAVVKYFFQPGVNTDLAYSQITGVSQSLLRATPPGTTPPFILAFNASTVPILQLALSSETLSEAQLFDTANTLLRTQLTTVRGAAIPYPFGGQQRQIQVDLNPTALNAYNLSAADVSSAIGAQNLILPAGTQKIGSLEYFIDINTNIKSPEELNNIPIKTVNNRVVFVRDVAHVRDGNPPQTNIVRRDGHRAVLMSVLKNGTASTLDIIKNIKIKLPQVKDTLPPELNIDLVGDQSLFVSAAISGVIQEAVIAAALTALMILLFLGSWRSTVIIAISIPLSILASLACLAALGETINIMTLGGLALAVGILVDDATVTIENINWHLEQGKDVTSAILEGAEQIAIPALVSTLAICIVFVPMFQMPGIAKFLFVPLAEAVVFAMLASYLLSRTLVPTLAHYWLQPHHPDSGTPTQRWARWQHSFERGFQALRQQYQHWLQQAVHANTRFIVPFMSVVVLTGLIAFPLASWLPGLGQDFFPSVDGGTIKLHMRARTGVRIDETTRLCDQVEDLIREVIPANERTTLVDNIGVPYSGINLTYSTSAPVGPGDADIFITLAGNHRPTAEYVKILRHRLREQFPGTQFSFLAADIVSQILNFGLPSPIDIQIAGFNEPANRELADRMLEDLKQIPGVVDMRIQQAFDYPQINVNVDRSRAALLGLTEQNVAQSLLITLSGSAQTAPSFWIEPKTGSGYAVTAQAPQYFMQSLNDLGNVPVNASNSQSPQLLSNVATFERANSAAVVNHYNAQPVIDIFGSVEGSDLGFVSAQVQHVLAKYQKDLARGTKVTVRGQVQTMNDAFSGLLWGLLAAVVLIYLLMVVNFQSWLDPFIIITALPAALAGIVWMLFITHTTVSVPALTGAIMCMGVATANSVLIVSFARERVSQGVTPLSAAIEAGVTRFRPVLMTALAMIIGMIPMALGLGDGGEQNAPLGRAVIGGLSLATLATLFLVPTVFAYLHRDRQAALTPTDSA